MTTTPHNDPKAKPGPTVTATMSEWDQESATRPVSRR
jgi:hypothetical protein